MKLIAWLWNPWEKYKTTRHNVWFRFVDAWVDNKWLWIWKYEGKYKSEIIQTEQIEPSNILIIHDEIDFVTARIALKFWWSPAWHNGLKSIIEKLWTKDFWRLRIWIDRPATSKQVVDRVLSSFKPEEKKNLIEKEDEIYNLIEEFIENK